MQVDISKHWMCCKSCFHTNVPLWTSTHWAVSGTFCLLFWPYAKLLQRQQTASVQVRQRHVQLFTSEGMNPCFSLFLFLSSCSSNYYPVCICLWNDPQSVSCLSFSSSVSSCYSPSLSACNSSPRWHSVFSSHSACCRVGAHYSKMPDSFKYGDCATHFQLPSSKAFSAAAAQKGRKSE